MTMRERVFIDHGIEIYRDASNVFDRYDAG